MVSLRPFQYVLLVSPPHERPLALLGACWAAAGLLSLLGISAVRQVLTWFSQGRLSLVRLLPSEA